MSAHADAGHENGTDYAFEPLAASVRLTINSKTPAACLAWEQIAERTVLGSINTNGGLLNT